MYTFHRFFLLITGLLAGLIAGAQTSNYQLSISNLTGVPSAIVDGTSYDVSITISNVGNNALAAGDLIQFKLSVNEDSPTEFGAPLLLSAPLFPGQSIQWTEPSFPFPAGRFGGGVSNDIIVWPTVIGMPTTTDTITQTVLFINGAAFRTDPSMIQGVSNAIYPGASYALNCGAQNVGKDKNTQAISFYVQVDALPAHKISETEMSVNVGELAKGVVETFNLALLYPSVNFSSGTHIARFWAVEDGKQNVVNKAAYPIQSGTFPVDIAFFNATSLPAENQISTTWKTLNEFNNQSFEVQKLNNETGHYTTLGTSLSFGTEHLYQIVDKVPYWGENTYRLLQTDLDGTTRILETVSVNYQINEDIRLLSASPNPVADKWTISLFNNFDETVMIKLIDTQGRTVYSYKEGAFVGNYTAELDLQALPTGLYYYQISNLHNAVSGSIVKK